MPAWLEVFYMIFSVLVLGWAVWISKIVLSTQREMATIAATLAGVIKTQASYDKHFDGFNKTVSEQFRQILYLIGKLEGSIAGLTRS